MKWYQHLIIIFLCTLALFIPPTLANSLDRVIDVGQINSEPVSLTEYFDVLEDPSNALILTDIERPEISAKFIPSGSSADSLNFSFTESAYWLRLKVRNSSERPLDQLLEIANARLANVKLYGAQSHTLASGFAVPFAQRPYSHRFIVFPLSLAPNTTQIIYLRIETQTPMEIPAKLWMRSAFLPYERNDYMIQASFFGMVFAMVVFNLLLLISLRDVSFLKYVIWISFAPMVMMSTTGLGMEFLWDDVPNWTAASYGFFALLGTSALIVFMREMIAVRVVAPKADHLLKALTGFNLLLAFVAFLDYKIFAISALLTVTFETILILIISAYCATKGLRSARFFVVAFFIYIVAILINNLRLAGTLPSNVLTVNGVQLGSAIEMILLAFALADRYNQLRREKARIQKRLVENLRTSERLLEEKVEQRTAELSAAFETNETIIMHSPLPIIVISAKGQCIEVNDAYAQLVGEPRERLLTINTTTNKIWLDSGMVDECQSAIESNSPRQREIQVVVKFGKALWLDVRLLPIKIMGLLHVLVQVVDLTERKRHEEELKGLAFHDALTQLPNRRLLLDRLSHAMANSKRMNSHGAVLFLDLNKFKQLNDTYGHEAGDQLLVEVARRLKEISRETDTVARLGGDEFVVLFESLGKDATQAAKFAEQASDKISRLLTEEYVLGDIRHQASASTGITLFLGDEVDPCQIIKDADTAMYEAKRAKPR